MHERLQKSVLPSDKRGGFYLLKYDVMWFVSYDQTWLWLKTSEKGCTLPKDTRVCVIKCHLHLLLLMIQKWFFFPVHPYFCLALHYRRFWLLHLWFSRVIAEFTVYEHGADMCRVCSPTVTHVDCLMKMDWDGARGCVKSLLGKTELTLKGVGTGTKEGQAWNKSSM